METLSPVRTHSCNSHYPLSSKSLLPEFQIRKWAKKDKVTNARSQSYREQVIAKPAQTLKLNFLYLLSLPCKISCWLLQEFLSKPVSSNSQKGPETENSHSLPASTRTPLQNRDTSLWSIARGYTASQSSRFFLKLSEASFHRL